MRKTHILDIRYRIVFTLKLDLALKIWYNAFVKTFIHMEFIFRFIWVAICAFLVTILIEYIDTHTGFLQTLFFPQMIDFIHGFGLSAKKVLFISLFLFFYLTALDKYIGRGLFLLLGMAFWVVIIGLVILCSYWFLSWLAGCL